VLSVAFSPNGKLAATGGDHDRQVKVWDAATWQEIRPLTLRGRSAFVGGGIYNDGSTASGVSALTITASTITYNVAQGGKGDCGGSGGQGIGGGLYLGAGGSVCLDVTTVVANNLASTTNDDVFGDLTTCP
jgi:WD40 repeat protein